MRGWLPFVRFPVACPKSNPSSYSRAILKRGTRKTSLRHKYVRQSKGRRGRPVARFWKTGAQGGASQPYLQCLQTCTERRILSGECANTGLKHKRKAGVRCRRLGGERMKTLKQTGRKTGEGKYLFWSFWTHQRFQPQKTMALARPAKREEGS